MILSGIVAASGGGFVATGGTLYTDGVWNHHVFNSSGNFQVVSGEKNVIVYSQYGGWDGFGINVSGSSFQSGEGGPGGAYGIYSGNLSSSLTITVGAGGNNSSYFSGATLSPVHTEGYKLGGGIQSAYQSSYYVCDEYGCYPQYYWAWYPIWASSPVAGKDLRTVLTEPYTSLSAFTGVTTGGGGGGGRIVVNNSSVSQNPYLGAASGGGNGAISRTSTGSNTNATNGAPNTGGGGGGGAASANQNGGGGWNVWNTVARGLGGSGRVVVSYLVN